MMLTCLRFLRISLEGSVDMDLREFWIILKQDISEIKPLIIGVGVGLLTWMILNS